MYVWQKLNKSKKRKQVFHLTIEYTRGGQPTARGHFFALETIFKCPSNIFRIFK
jgi:hypothetical protein